MAKATDKFKQTIKKELDIRAFKNPLFEKKYNNPDKNIDDCIAYIFKTVQASGSNGFEDDEIFGMAIHYYSEDNVDVKNAPSISNVVVNHKPKLTQEEKDEALREAKERVISEEMSRIRGKNKKPSEKPKEQKSSDDTPNTLF